MLFGGVIYKAKSTFMRRLKESRFFFGRWSPYVYSAECHNLQKYYKLIVFNYIICVCENVLSESREGGVGSLGIRQSLAPDVGAGNIACF